MNPRALLVFKHDTPLGNAPSHKLFDLVTVTKKPDVEAPRSFNDYDLTINEAAIPNGVTLIRRI
jgi:CRISPR-associated protein Csd2